MRSSVPRRLPLAAFAGRYENPILGPIVIRIERGGLTFPMGQGEWPIWSTIRSAVRPTPPHGFLLDNNGDTPNIVDSLGNRGRGDEQCW